MSCPRVLQGGASTYDRMVRSRASAWLDWVQSFLSRDIEAMGKAAEEEAAVRSGRACVGVGGATGPAAAAVAPALAAGGCGAKQGG